MQAGAAARPIRAAPRGDVGQIGFVSQKALSIYALLSGRKRRETDLKNGYIICIKSELGAAVFGFRGERKSRLVLHVCCTECAVMSGNALIINDIYLYAVATRFK